jgi:hypothetical protein
MVLKTRKEQGDVEKGPASQHKNFRFCCGKGVEAKRMIILNGTAFFSSSYVFWLLCCSSWVSGSLAVIGDLVVYPALRASARTTIPQPRKSIYTIQIIRIFCFAKDYW